MESQPADPTILNDALELLDECGTEAREIERNSSISIRKAGQLTGGAPFIEGTVTIGRNSLAVSYAEDGGAPSYNCSDCGEYGCEHVLLLLCAHFGVKLSGLSRLYDPQKDPNKRQTTEPDAPPIAAAAAQNNFASLVAARLGRPLAPDEVAYANDVDSLYRRNANSPKVSPNAFDAFLKPNPLPAWELVELWPSRPKSVWEAWFYLSSFLSQRGERIPEFLRALTTEEEVSALLGDWQHKQALRHWEDGLEGLLEAMERHTVRPRVGVRLEIGKDAARLQFKRETDTGWITMTDRQFLDTAASCDQSATSDFHAARRWCTTAA